MNLPILAAAQNYPDHIAFDGGRQQISYGQLLPSASIVLPTSEIQPGDRLAWCPGNDKQAFLTFWAIQLGGGIACPISHRLPDAKRKEVLKRLDAKWLPGLPDRIDGNAAAQREIETVNFDPDRAATIILSSGSTGVPKAVVHSMSAHIANALGATTNMPLNPGDRWLWSLPLCHVSGLSILIRCAASAATAVGMEEGDRLNANLLNERRVSHLSVVATQLRRLLEDPQFPSPHLKFVLLGGSSLDAKLVESARQRGVPVVTTYGLTEMGSQVTASATNGAPAGSGKVLPGREIDIASSGQILVRGSTLCLGYLRDGVIQPIVDEQGWFPTGDLGSLDRSGQLTVLGRMDNMFISGGENIHPENIERAILRCFAVDQVVVVPKADAAFGARPVAFVDGSMPSNWRALLGSVLSGFEIPIEVRPWPREAKLAIKPDRRMLAALVRD